MKSLMHISNKKYLLKTYYCDGRWGNLCFLSFVTPACSPVDRYSALNRSAARKAKHEVWWGVQENKALTLPSRGSSASSTSSRTSDRRARLAMNPTSGDTVREKLFAWWQLYTPNPLKKLHSRRSLWHCDTHQSLPVATFKLKPYTPKKNASQWFGFASNTKL